MEINKSVSAIIIFVITLILVFLFVLPKYQESTMLESRLIVKQAEYTSKSAYYAKISKLLSGIETRKDVLGSIESALPPKVSFAPLVYFLQKKGSENGLVVKSITFSQASVTPSSQSSLGNLSSNVKDIVFSVTMLGNYQGLKNFIASLEKSTRLFEINTISFVSLESLQGLEKTKNKLQTYEFRLEIKTHTY